MGALDYFGTWSAWERDEDKRGQLAAKIWKQANEQTREAFEMGCFDELIEAIENIQINNTYGSNCFCDTTEINPNPPTIPDITNEVGDPPGTYGGQDVSDWLQWRRKVCATADAYVNVIKAQNTTLKQAISLSIITVGLIGAVMAVIASGGLLLAVSWSTVVAVVSGLLAAGSTSAFDGFDDDIESVREDIVRAIVCSGNLSTVIQGAIDPTAWNLFYQFVNWSQASRVIRAGEVSGEYFDGTQESDACDDYCVLYDWELIYEFEFSNMGWGLTWQDTKQSIVGQITPSSIFAGKTLVNLRVDAGLDPGTPMYLTEFHAITRVDPDAGTPTTDNFTGKLQWYQGGWVDKDQVDFTDIGPWHSLSYVDYDSPYLIKDDGVRVFGQGLGSSGGTYQAFDTIVLRGKF